MPNEVTPELLNFIITLCQFMLIAFGILIAGAAVVYTTLFWKGNFSGASIAEIIAGEAVIALLSGIAGYVLGNRAAPKGAAPD